MRTLDLTRPLSSCAVLLAFDRCGAHRYMFRLCTLRCCVVGCLALLCADCSLSLCLQTEWRRSAPRRKGLCAAVFAKLVRTAVNLCMISSRAYLRKHVSAVHTEVTPSCKNRWQACVDELGSKDLVNGKSTGFRMSVSNHFLPIHTYYDCTGMGHSSIIRDTDFWIKRRQCFMPVWIQGPLSQVV